MKKFLIISTVAVMSFQLAGCNTVSNAVDGTTRFASSTVGTGMKFTAATVGTGVGLVGNTGFAVGSGVHSVVKKGVGWMGGKSTNYQKAKYNTKAQTVYQNGHHYMLKNGQYIRVD